MIYRVTEILYDTDGEDVELPQTMDIEVDDDLSEEEALDYIGEEISSRTSFCHNGFTVEKLP